MKDDSLRMRRAYLHKDTNISVQGIQPSVNPARLDTSSFLFYFPERNGQYANKQTSLKNSIHYMSNV